MFDRRRLLQSAALGAGLVAVSGPAFARQAGASQGDAAAQLKTFMDATFEQTLDKSPEVVTMFGLDKGDRAAAKSKLTVPTRAEEDDQRAFTRRQRAELSRIDRSKLDARNANYYDSLTQNLDGVIATFDRLPIRLEAVPRGVEESVDRPLANRMTLGLEFGRQVGRTLARPPQWRHRVATGHRIDQDLKGTLELRVVIGQGLPPAPTLSYPPGGCRPIEGWRWGMEFS